MLRYKVLENLFVFCSLPQGETNRFIKAFIYKTDGSFALGGDGSLPLSHQSNGFYKSSLIFNLAAGVYKILYKPYLDLGYTQEDNVYGTKEETLEIYESSDLSNLEDKIDALSASMVDSNYEVVLEEAEELEVSVENEDDLELEIEG
jgi:hypothetical protein